MNKNITNDSNNHKRTIIHVSECYEGGISRAIRNIKRVLPEDSHMLVASGADVYTDRDIFDLVTELPSNPVLAAKTIRGISTAASANIIHAHSSWAGFYARILPQPCPIIYQPHCYAFEDPQRRKIFRTIFWLIERLLSHHTQGILYLSPREGRLAHQINPRVPSYYLPNIPTLPEMSSQQKSKRQFGDSVCMIGRVVPQKDPAFYVRVMNIVHQKMQCVKFMWIGDGEESEVARLTDSGIRVTGWLNEKELIGELSKVGVYLHSASYEGFPLSVLDAASQGVPIIARSIPCFVETCLMQRETPEELASLIINILEDGATRQEVIDRGNELLNSMDERAQLEALNRAYRPERN